MLNKRKLGTSLILILIVTTVAIVFRFDATTVLTASLILSGIYGAIE